MDEMVEKSHQHLLILIVFSYALQRQSTGTL
jgi:hypothetical protein